MDILLALITLIDHSSWVIFLAVLLFIYRKKLPNFFDKLESFKAGGVEVKFSKKLHSKFSQEQISKFSELSFEEMDVFLLVSFLTADADYQTGMEKGIFKKYMLRLQEIGLLKILNPENDGNNLRRELTEDGRKLRKFLVESSTDLLEFVATK